MKSNWKYWKTSGKCKTLNFDWRLIMFWSNFGSWNWPNIYLTTDWSLHTIENFVQLYQLQEKIGSLPINLDFLKAFIVREQFFFLLLSHFLFLKKLIFVLTLIHVLYICILRPIKTYYILFYSCTSNFRNHLPQVSCMP